MIDFDDDEEPLNRKDITAEITGRLYDLDDEEEGAEQFAPPQETAPTEPHPFIGIMDMLISTSKEPLAKAGYPAPNTAIWDEWGKPNLSKAFYQYLPIESGAGAAMNSPAFAGVIGFGALVIAFLPVIIHHISKSKEKREKKEEKKSEQSQPPMPKEPDAPKRQPMKIETPDRAEPKFVKLAGGGEEAKLPIPMMDLIAQNMGADPQPI